MKAEFFQTRWRRWAAVWLVLFLALGLGGCGGAGGDSSSPPPLVSVPVNPVGAGQFKEVTPIQTLSLGDIASALGTLGDQALQVKPRYGVAAYRMTYLTQDGYGQPITASALVVVPQKAAGASSPVLSYQHATIKRNAQAPSYLADLASPEIVMASLGFLVVSSDYVGYGASHGAAHPYLLAAPSAAAVIDLLTASKYWRETQKIADNGQLFLAGYSEGGYVTMAAARALQLGTSPHLAQLVSVVPGAGPYNAALTLDELLGLVRDEYPLIGWLLHPGLLKYLSDSDRDNVRNALLKALMGDDADVLFLPAVLDAYLADERDRMEIISDVDNWLPSMPVHLFHGREDQTVSFYNSSNTFQKMQALGAGSRVSLTECTTAPPAGHLPCVGPYFEFVIKTLAAAARDL